jgi:hypothetical protein
MKAMLALAAAIVAVTPLARATDVGVSIAISQPGVYGRIDIGRFPQPVVVVPQPVIIAPPRPVAAPQPVYMWVPREHRKDWGRYCLRYGACGVPVYFVRHDWYDQHVRHSRGDRDDDDREDRGRARYRGGEYKEKYDDGTCKVEREWKRDGSYKEERECKAGRGSFGDRRAGEYKEKYWEGPCEVEREWKSDGSYKDKRDCKG